MGDALEGPADWLRQLKGSPSPRPSPAVGRGGRYRARYIAHSPAYRVGTRGEFARYLLAGVGLESPRTALWVGVSPEVIEWVLSKDGP